MYLHKEYVEHDGKTIKFAVCYEKGKRYRLTAVPVKRTVLGNGVTIEETGAMTGFNDTLLEADRQSSKRLKEALLVLRGRKEKYLEYFNK